MTTQKGFKRVVRERMAKTGERYAAARRALIAAEPNGTAATARIAEPTPTGYALRGGIHPETATLANVLANRGVTSPLDGRPLSEAMILGIGGGLGAGYILWEFEAHRLGTILTLGFRNQWQYPGVPGWYGKTIARLGVETDIHETGGAKGAAQTLDTVLERGHPAIAFVDQQHLGTWGQPDSPSGWWQVVVFERRPDGSYLVDDRGRAPFVVDAARMAAARGRVGSFKHRLFVPKPVPGPIDAARLRQAIRAGLEDQVEHLRASSDSFSLPAWRKWSRLMTDQRNAKAWPKLFADGRGLFGALLSIVEGVDGEIGATGGHLRELYAAFLDEAAPVLDLPGLNDAAAAWRTVADQWEDLADAALPAAVPGAAEAVDTAEALHDAAMEGEPGRARTTAAERTLRATRERYAEAFPLPADAIGGLFADLGGRIGALYDAERAALAVTARAIGRG